MLPMKVNHLAGKPAPAAILINIETLITAYYEDRPDPQLAEQRVIFGTSGHRGSSIPTPRNWIPFSARFSERLFESLK